METARKLFILFKSLNEWAKIREFLKQETSFEKYLAIATRIAFLVYFIFDNLSVLAKIKFFPSLDAQKQTSFSLKFWLLGLLLCIWQGIHTRL